MFRPKLLLKGWAGGFSPLLNDGNFCLSYGGLGSSAMDDSGHNSDSKQEQELPDTWNPVLSQSFSSFSDDLAFLGRAWLGISKR